MSDTERADSCARSIKISRIVESGENPLRSFVEQLKKFSENRRAPRAVPTRLFAVNFLCFASTLSKRVSSSSRQIRARTSHETNARCVPAMSVRARRGAMRRAASAGASALVAVALCVATCAARVGVVAADGASWSEDLDGLDEFLLDSPRLTEKFLQEAVRAERAKPEFNASDQPKLIFPGGKLHDRAMRVGADRGMLRLGGPPPVEPPALAGEAGAKGAAALSASRVGAGNATLGEDGSTGRRPARTRTRTRTSSRTSRTRGDRTTLGFSSARDANASAEDAGDGADLPPRLGRRAAARAARRGWARSS